MEQGKDNPLLIDIGLWVGAVSLFLLSLLSFVGVVSRNIIFVSIPWAIELSQMFLMWMVYFGTAAVSYHHDHIIADVLGPLLNEKAKKIRQTISDIVIFIILAVVVSNMIPYTIKLTNTRRVTPALGIPQWFLYCTFIIGLLLLTGEHLINIIHGLIDIRVFMKSSNEEREVKGKKA
ncbi:MAG: hypothetical protein SAMD01599839_25380 [Rectinema sp.]